jgi:hypothetical protein
MSLTVAEKILEKQKAWIQYEGCEPMYKKDQVLAAMKEITQLALYKGFHLGKEGHISLQSKNIILNSLFITKEE